MDEIKNEINERAIEWSVRLDGNDLSADERLELETWLAKDTRHAGAFLRARSIWNGLDRLAILPVPQAGKKQTRFTPRVWFLAGGTGLAAVAAAFIFVIYFWSNALHIVTPVGEIRRIPLADGSVATVNTDSNLSVSLNRDIREVTLDRGEVWFKVAKDKERPFVVAAGNVRVRAVGTAFSVRRMEDGADVLVTEGTVEVWNVTTVASMRRVGSGLKVFVSDIAAPSRPVKAPLQIDHQLAWRNGEVVLDGETLTEAAEEFNRYNRRKITIDPALKKRQLVGLFRVDEPETFARAAAMTLDATAIERSNEIHLAPKQN